MGKPVKLARKPIIICASRHDNMFTYGDTLDEAHQNYKDSIEENVHVLDLVFYEAVEIEIEIKTVITPVNYVTAK